MKVCAVIAEYNPLHLGHLKQIEYVKNVLKAEKIIVIMSGNFTQRGEPAILDKFTRSKLALLAGADLVIELPTVFACGNAEVFAKGAINILNGLNVVDGICFGVERIYRKGCARCGRLLWNDPCLYRRNGSGDKRLRGATDFRKKYYTSVLLHTCGGVQSTDFDWRTYQSHGQKTF